MQPQYTPTYKFSWNNPSNSPSFREFQVFFQPPNKQWVFASLPNHRLTDSFTLKNLLQGTHHIGTAPPGDPKILGCLDESYGDCGNLDLQKQDMHLHIYIYKSFKASIDTQKQSGRFLRSMFVLKAILSPKNPYIRFLTIAPRFGPYPRPPRNITKSKSWEVGELVVCVFPVFGNNCSWFIRLSFSEYVYQLWGEQLFFASTKLV